MPSFSRYDYFLMSLDMHIGTYFKKGFFVNKLLGMACVSSVLLFSGCTWFDWKGSDKTSCSIEQKSECPCGIKDCHCPEGKCTCKKELVKEAEGTNSSVLAINSEKEFDEKVLDAKKPAVVEFSATWCGACRTMKPIFEEVAKEMGDKYIFADVDVDKAESVAKKYDIKGIPAFLFFKNGKEAKDSERIIGAVSKENFKKTVDDSLGD